MTIAQDLIETIPLVDLKRRYDFMMLNEGGSISEKLDKCKSLAEVLKYSFEDLSLYWRLKESIRRCTVHSLDNIEDYFKFVIYNHAEPKALQPIDYELVVYFNSRLLAYLMKRFKTETTGFLKYIEKTLEPVTWFDKDIDFWIKAEYMAD